MSSYRDRTGALPPRQQHLLDFIDREIAAGRPFPTKAAMQRHMDWKNETSVRDCLMRLLWRGRLRYAGWSRTEFERVRQ